MAPPAQEKRLVAVNVEQFVRTRDALNTAFLGLSASIDKAIKAYIDHTQAVLDGDSTLDISYLTQPFNSLTNAAHIAQQAIGFQNGATLPANGGEGEKRRKRAYKPRDPNAPKRPLTAYFRYLGEVRPVLAAELAADPNRETGKAGDISKVATERWNALTAEQQAPYRAAYKKEMVKYDEDVAKYKAVGGEDVKADLPETATALAGADDDDDDDDDDDSSSSDESSSDDEALPPPPPPPPKPKSSSPEAVKKTPKPAKRAVEYPAAPTPQFSSINPVPDVEPAAVETATATKKRKGPATVTAGEDEPAAKKRGRKTKAEKAADDAAAAAAQLNPEPASTDAAPEVDGKKAKKEKKKRKSEAAAA